MKEDKTMRKKIEKSGRQFYLAENAKKAYLHEPGLEAEPGPPAPTPSSPRAWSSGSPSPPASILPPSRSTSSGEKGRRGPLSWGGVLFGPYLNKAQAQLPPSFQGESGGKIRKEDDNVNVLTYCVDTDRTSANGSTAFILNRNEDRCLDNIVIIMSQGTTINHIQPWDHHHHH